MAIVIPQNDRTEIERQIAAARGLLRELDALRDLAIRQERAAQKYRAPSDQSDKQGESDE